MKVSFDFDETLTNQNVQDYARELIQQGLQVHITTSRSVDHWNEDLLEIAYHLKIPMANIYFTQMRSKSNFLLNSDFIWHLDDDYTDLNLINSRTKVIGVNVMSPNWKEKCNNILEGNCK